MVLQNVMAIDVVQNNRITSGKVPKSWITRNQEGFPRTLKLNYVDLAVCFIWHNVFSPSFVKFYSLDTVSV